MVNKQILKTLGILTRDNFSSDRRIGSSLQELNYEDLAMLFQTACLKKKSLHTKDMIGENEVSQMRIAMAQMNPTVGDLDGNAGKILEYVQEATQKKADMIFFPELALVGYPPQDLLYERSFVKRNRETLDDIIKSNTGLVGVIGFVDFDNDGNLYNAAAIFEGNKLSAVAHKALLPTYDVFDEARYFKPADTKSIRAFSIELGGKRVSLGIEICEDLWDEKYKTKVTDMLVQRGAELIVNVSASPFYAGKRYERESLLREKALKNRIPIFYVNLVGGQDDLVFDGQSLAVDASGNLIAFGRQFEEDLVITDIDPRRYFGPHIIPPPYNRDEEVFNALTLGIRDYFRKNSFKKAVIGISGGIDSSLTTCLAVEALGRENVIGVSMPSKFSSKHSMSDAEKLAENLGICFIKFPIQEIIECYRRTLEKPLQNIREYYNIEKDKDNIIADENIQPRIRANSLWDISNRLEELGILVLGTGNKTELALGYCTIYGDMAAGFGALGDVSKLEVYRLAEYVNRRANMQIIPENVFKKKPSPELKEGQFSPFDFSIVSPMVDEIIENRRSKKELMEMGYPKEIVEDVYRRIRKAEYKRRQASPSIKITQKAFGIGWRMPIVNGYEG